MKRSIKKLMVLILALLMVVSTLAGCTSKGSKTDEKKTEGSNKKGNIIVANLGAEPKTLDPALNSAVDGSTVIFNIFEGLVRIGMNDKPEAGLAKDWKISTDGKVYTFNLRDNLKWGDGTPLTAEDVKYGMMRVLDSKTASPYSYHAYCIKNAEAYNKNKAKAEDVGIKVIDTKTLEITLDYPVPYFLDILSWHLMLPLKKDVVEKNPNNWAAEPATLIGNGPFKVTEWKHNDYIMLEKNPNYWDANNVKAEKVKLSMISDANTALTAYKTGQVDLIISLPAAQTPQLLKSGEAKSLSQLGPYFYALNVTKKPLDNVKVRKALSMAIDRESLANVILKGGQKPAVGFMPYGIAGATSGKDFRDEGKTYIETKANVEEAKKLLAEAGYADGKGFPELTFLYNSNEMHKSVAEAIQAMWKKNLGINIKLANQEWKVFLTTRGQGDYEIARHGYVADFNDAGSLFDLWVTGSPNNDVKYANTEYDKLVVGARKEQDKAKRAEMYHKAEDILMEDMPIIPLFFYTQNYMLNSNVKNMHISPLGWLFFRNAEITK